MKKSNKMISMIALTVATLTAAASALADPVTVIALVKVKPGTEVAFKAAVEQILAPTRAEVGNLRYEFNQSTTDPTQFATSERWASPEAAQAHLSTPHMTAFFGVVGDDFVEGYPQINEYVEFGDATN